MQLEATPNKNTFTCQNSVPNIREKFKNSSNFLRIAFTGLCSVLTTIVNKIFNSDDLSLYPGFKKYKNTIIENIDGFLHAHYFLDLIDNNKNIFCKHCQSKFERLNRISSKTITLKDYISNVSAQGVARARGMVSEIFSSSLICR